MVHTETSLPWLLVGIFMWNWSRRKHFIKHVYKTWSNIYKKLAKYVKGDRIRCNWYTVNWISSVLVYPLEKKYIPEFVIESIQSKKTLTGKLKMVNVSFYVTVASRKYRLLKYQKSIMKNFQQLWIEENSIFFYSGKDVAGIMSTLSVS